MLLKAELGDVGVETEGSRTTLDDTSVAISTSTLVSGSLQLSQKKKALACCGGEGMKLLVGIYSVRSDDAKRS